MKSTSSKSSRSSNGTASSRLKKPLDPKALAAGRRLARQYRLVIEPDTEAGFHGASVEMPLVFGEGATPAACMDDTLEALAVTIAVMLELGQRPPSPASAGKRESQVNVRMNADEKMQIEELARRAGFRSISDYLRTSALRQAS